MLLLRLIVDFLLQSHTLFYFTKKCLHVFCLFICCLYDFLMAYWNFFPLHVICYKLVTVEKSNGRVKLLVFYYFLRGEYKIMKFFLFSTLHIKNKHFLKKAILHLFLFLWLCVHWHFLFLVFFWQDECFWFEKKNWQSLKFLFTFEGGVFLTHCGWWVCNFVVLQ